MLLFASLLIVVLCLNVSSFTSPRSRFVQTPTIRSSLSMEYIPDGMSKAQWNKLKAAEAAKEKEMSKNYGKIGITKFKSRSFEAWQKSGGKNLFPVDPSTPLEERPYMQRTGGQADGSDLKKKGLFGRGQGAGSTRLDVDDKYDNLEKEGKLRSFAFEVPWSNKQLEEQNKKKIEETRKATMAAKAKETKTAKKTAFSFGRKKAPEPEPEPVPEPKKKLFGLF